MAITNDIPLIIAQNGPLDGSKWALTSDITLGRGEDCDVIIDDRQVSRYHAKISFHEPGEAIISDLSSKNGTYVNSELISSAKQLNDGDIIKIAPVSYTHLTLPTNREV